MKTKTYLVTGGAGFIGSNFINYLIKTHKNDEIICLDALTYAGNINNVSNHLSNDRFKFVRSDIRNRSSIEKIFKIYNPDVVVNFAAESHVDRSIENPQIFLETNILGTSIIMDCSLKYGVERFHQISTDEVYGDLPLERPELLFTETTPLHTSSPYSSSKASADLLVMAYERTYGLPASISRCSNNYGPYQFPEKLIPLMISKALANESLPIYGDGLNVRDWLYVEDHCTAIDLIINKAKNGSIYNVGGNNEMPNIDIVKIILDKLSKPDYLIKYVPDRKGHDRRYAIDSSKIRRELGWTPHTNFNEGISKTIDWYLSNMLWTNEILSGNYISKNNKVEFV